GKGAPGLMGRVLGRGVGDVGTDAGSLDRRLYELLVDDGRLRETYASFVRDVIQVAVPTPGMWADAGIVEHDDSTTLVSRRSRTVGDGHEGSTQLTGPPDRGAERRLALCIGPITTRVVYTPSPRPSTPR